MRQVIFTKDGAGGYVAEVPSLPGCRVKGKNLSEAIFAIRKAIYAHIDSLQAAGEPIPPSTLIEVPKQDGVISERLLLREDVIQAAQKQFPGEDLQTILDILDTYGKEKYETDCEYVHMAIIGVSEGNVDKLLRFVADAKRDYRDVVAYYATKFGKYPAPEA